MSLKNLQNNPVKIYLQNNSLYLFIKGENYNENIWSISPKSLFSMGFETRIKGPILTGRKIRIRFYIWNCLPNKKYADRRLSELYLRVYQKCFLILSGAFAGSSLTVIMISVSLETCSSSSINASSFCILISLQIFVIESI